MSVPLPCDSARSRVWWSAGAAAIVAVWTLGVLGAGCTSFPKDYSPAELFAAIAHGGWAMVWPGEFGNDTWLAARCIQVSPVFPAVMWPLVLVPWRTRAARIASSVAALLVPGWILWPLNPAFLLFGPLGLSQLVLGTSGEMLQDGWLVGAGVSLWCWMLLGTTVVTIRRPVAIPGCCGVCGYSLAGLDEGAACPECGSGGAAR